MPHIWLRIIEGDFAVCKINDISEVDFGCEYVFLSKTDEELSLVCAAQSVPETAVKVEGDFCAFKIEGILDFGLTGIISGISGILAKNGISVFVVSTFDTDYVLIKHESLDNAVRLLHAAGYGVRGGGYELPARETGARVNPVFAIFAIIGSLLIGAGIILILATNWWKISKEAKTCIAFLPLVAAQAVVLYTLIRKRGSAAFSEGSSLFLVLSVFAVNALIGQVFHSPIELEPFITTCVVLALPSVYLMNSKSAATVCVAGAMWAGLSYGQPVWQSMLILAALLPFFALRVYKTKSKHELWYVLLLLSAVLPYYIVKAAEEASSVFDAGGTEIALACGVALIVLDAAVWLFRKDCFFTPTKFAGFSVISVTLIVSSFPDNVDWYDYGFTFTVLLAMALLYNFITRPGKRKPNGTDFFVSAALLLSGLQFHWLAANALLAAIGVFYIYAGSRRYTLRHINFGMALVVFVIAARFFDSGLGLLARGVAFILLGACFLAVNYFIYRKKRAAGSGAR